MSSSNLHLTKDLPTSAEPEESSVGSTSGAASELPSAIGDGRFDLGGSLDAPTEPAQPDELAAAAVDLARAAAEETAEPGTVGDHLGVSVDEGGLTMHAFASRAKGYRGWRWAVTLAHVPGSDYVTVCDVVLLPGTESILAPAWVPWSDRLAPGDLGAGDDLPYRADDPLLVPGYTVTDPDDADQELFWELGLGRERVVGLEGLQAAAERWEHGPHGPTSEIAIQASAACVTCAYFLPVSGFLRQHFGACTNEWSPADGTVVTTDFGCGAHSETDLELPAPEPLPPHILDETIMEHVVIDRSAEPGLETGGSAEPSSSPETVATAEPEVTVAPEPLVEAESPTEPELLAEPDDALGQDGSAEPATSAEPVAEIPAELGEAAPPEPEAVTDGSAEPPAGSEPRSPAPSLDGSAEPPVEPESLVEMVAQIAPESVLESPPVESVPVESELVEPELVEPEPVESKAPADEVPPTP